MAWLDETLGGWGSTVLTSVVVTTVAPVLLPAIGTLLRPVIKGAIKLSLVMVDTMQDTLAEGGEQLSDLIAEAKAEYDASAHQRSA